MEDQETLETQEVVTQPEQSQDTAQPEATQEVINELQDIVDWTKDKRFEKNWSKDPNKLYSSYRSLEKEYPQLKQKYIDIEKKWNEFETSDDKKVVEFIKYVYNHPQLKTSVEESFKKWNDSLVQEKYGKELPENVVSQLRKIDELEAREKEREEQMMISELTTQYSTALSEVEKIAKEYSVEYTEKEFKKYLKENEIEPKYVKAAFLESVWPHLSKQTKINAQRDVVSNIRKNQSRAGISGTKTTPAPVKEKSFSDALREKVFSN